MCLWSSLRLHLDASWQVGSVMEHAQVEQLPRSLEGGRKDGEGGWRRRMGRLCGLSILEQ